MDEAPDGASDIAKLVTLYFSTGRIDVRVSDYIYARETRAVRDLIPIRLHKLPVNALDALKRQTGFATRPINLSANAFEEDSAPFDAAGMLAGQVKGGWARTSFVPNFVLASNCILKTNCFARADALNLASASVSEGYLLNVDRH